MMEEAGKDEHQFARLCGHAQGTRIQDGLLRLLLLQSQDGPIYCAWCSEGVGLQDGRNGTRRANARSPDFLSELPGIVPYAFAERVKTSHPGLFYSSSGAIQHRCKAFSFY